ncbi:MAG: MATE family efflux transporter [Candidatus Marinimicrobia bacterium]|jgi:putative MATE family efflux protein|nr:MATE family efflux transporter [Candidatus Neomarinimicrobiota bacterium]|tara:strand:+ start:2821 stop:4164 length:1344 start_codon:yes stop_codon:yes gene_type:complete
MQKESRLDAFIANPYKSMWKMAMPIIAGMMVQTLFNVVDIMFIGWLGADEVTAVAFVSPLFFIIIGLGVGIGTGTTATIAQYIGQKDKENAEKTASQTILIGFLSTIFLTVLGVIYGEGLLSILGAEGEILSIAYSYLRILTFGLGLVIFSMFFRAILAGEGETKIPMIIGLIGTVLNLILDPILIFTFDYGVRGAAFATIISQIAMVASYLFIIFVKKSTYISFNIRNLSLDNYIISKIFQIGIPSSLSMLIISFGQVVMNKILVNYSTEAVAAYQIVSRLDMLLFMPILGIAISLTTIVGMFYGAKEYKKLLSVVYYGINRAVIITTISVILFFMLAKNILPIFSSNLMVIDIGVTYLKVIILAYPAVGISVICSRVCQALGQGVPLLITTTTRVLILTAPLSYYFYYIGKPLEWVWYSQVFAILIAAIISYAWMKFYFKKFNIV